MSTTEEDLKVAFTGESEANQKYRAFAKVAEKEGFVNVAKLFRLTSEAERIHAEGHYRNAGHISTTLENLKAAIGGEVYESSTMYPPMLEEAIKENHKAKTLFAHAIKVEAVHAKLYEAALKAVSEGKDLETSNIYLCPICGYIEIGEVPEKCPVCGVPGAKFVESVAV